MHDLSEAKAIAPAEIRMPSLLAARAYLFSALGCLFRKFVERCARAQGMFEPGAATCAVLV